MLGRRRLVSRYALDVEAADARKPHRLIGAVDDNQIVEPMFNGAGAGIESADADTAVDGRGESFCGRGSLI